MSSADDMLATARARIAELEAEHSKFRRETAAGLRALLKDANGRIAKLEAEMAAYRDVKERTREGLSVMALDRETLAREAGRERELREATQEDVDALNAVVARQEKRIAELEDWQRRARAYCRYGANPTCNCSRCVERRYLLGEVTP
jgi:uncharacterized coiled-coil protein SlyX